LLPDDFIERPRMSRIYYDGKYYSYPLKRIRGAVTNLGIFRSKRPVHALFLPSWQRLPARRTCADFHQWVVNQFGERLFSIFFKTYTEKVWGMPCDEISADWAAQRIKGLGTSGAP
jgi:protoporphyrinogen oxidase